LLERGDGVNANAEEAAQWYRRAADQNHDEGLFNLGRAFENGIGVARDPAQARVYYERAAELGLEDASQALANLGQAAPQISSAQQQFEQGSQLYKANKYADAAKIFESLAQSGYAPAQLQIGYQYEFGEGVPQNAEEAAQWYRKSADQGYAIAQNILGALYENGRGVPEDWVEAARWFSKSAAQRNANGQFALGRAYQFGIGVPQDRQEAIRWFNEAASQGHNQANYWWNHLKFRGSFIGFRNDEEEQLVVANKLRTDLQLFYSEPSGITFRHSGERFAYLRDLRKETDRNEAVAAWNRRNEAYQRCLRGETGETTCTPP
jgi:TPR repeat protein